jgi:hypothetical protein
MAAEPATFCLVMGDMCHVKRRWRHYAHSAITLSQHDIKTSQVTQKLHAMARIVAKGLVDTMDSFALTESKPRHVSVLSFWSETAIWSYTAVCDQNDSTETCLGSDSVRAKLSMVLIRPLATIRAMACNFWVT